CPAPTVRAPTCTLHPASPVYNPPPARLPLFARIRSHPAASGSGCCGNRCVGWENGVCKALHGAGGTVARQGKRRRLIYLFLALATLVLGCAQATAEEVIRLSQNVPGDSKPILLHADDIAT